MQSKIIGGKSIPRQIHATANLRGEWPAPIKPIIIFYFLYIIYSILLTYNILKAYIKKRKLALLARPPI